MKKLGLFVLPLMTISLLASCGGDTPTPPGPTPTKYALTVSCTDCTPSGNKSEYEEGANVSFTITPKTTYILPEKKDVKVTGVTSFEYTITSGVATFSCTMPAKAVTVTISATKSTKYYFIDFESNGGSPVLTQKVKEGDKVTKPTEPSRTGYVFGGWYSDEKFKYEYTFEEVVTGDLTLYAKWDNSYHFTFSGTNCLVNGTNIYEVDIPMKKTDVKFVIVPKAGYLLPTGEDFHITKGENVSYNDQDGTITISEMTGNVVVAAKSIHSPTTNWEFRFVGTNCTINGKSDYRTFIKKDSTNVQFTILPNSGYTLPKTEDVKFEGDNATYDSGIITISQMTGNVSVTAVARESETTYTISFSCDKCKAGTSESKEEASYQFITQRSSADESIVLHLFPDDKYVLPDDITITFGNGECNSDDSYVYDRVNKTITIYKRANALISLTKTKHTVTFDADEGEFFGGTKVLSVEVADGTNLSQFIRILNVRPTLKDKIFAYYMCSFGEFMPTKIRYQTTILEDIKLSAKYFDVNKPYGDLEDMSWDDISSVAIANPNPNTCFELGATKTVMINGQNHQVRIIGFNHDTTTKNNITTGVTFEFANLISDPTGDAVITPWNKNDEESNEGVYNYNFPSSHLNNYLSDELFNSIPYDLVENMVKVNKNVGINEKEEQGEENYAATSYEATLFPLAYNELFDSPRESVTSGEGTIYEYYKKTIGDDKYKKMDVNGDQVRYWLRSPCTGFAAMAWSVYDAAGALRIDDITTYPVSIAPAFCL